MIDTQDGSDEKLRENWSTLREDSLYSRDTYEYTRRTMTPVMASLAELVRSTPQYEDNYEWFVELAKNFHWIQSKMVESVDKVFIHLSICIPNKVFLIL